MRNALVAFSLSMLLAAPSPQDPAEGGEEEVVFPPLVSDRTREDFQKVLERMQGAWQLVEIRLPAAETVDRQEVAFLLVCQEFMSIELHLGYFDAENFLEESYFQSGTYRLGMDDRGLLMTSTLIGSVFDDDERLVFEPPGLRRLYDVQVEDELLTLVRFQDGARFIFARLATLSAYDFYGRALEKEAKDAPAETGEEEPKPPQRP